MSKTARRARIASIIELLCNRFPQAFSRRAPQPLKVGVYGDALAALGDAVQSRDLQSGLRAYTSNGGYLRALTAGTPRIGLDGNPSGTVTPEDEAVAKGRLAELAKATAAGAMVVPAKGPEPPATTPTPESPKPPAPKRLSLAD